MSVTSIFNTLLCLSILLKAFGATAQTGLVKISAQVLDQETGKPLPYANVVVAGKTIGTVSNEKGEFDFNIPAEFGKDSLKVSYLGYKSFAMTIEEVLKQQLTVIRLKEDPLLLKEIVVTNSMPDAREIVKRAVANIKHVFGNDEFVLDGFYRYWFLMDNRDREDEATIAEAAVTIADKGYAKASDEKVFVKEFRKIEAPSHSYGSNSLIFFFMQNYVKHNKSRANIAIPNALNFPNKLNYELENVATTDDGELYIIKVDIKDLFASYKLYINADDYALMQIDLVAQSPAGKYIYKKPADTTYKMVSINNTLRFRKFEGKNYLSYMRQNWSYERVDSLNKVAEVGENYEELLVNNIVTGKKEVSERLKQPKEVLLKENSNVFSLVKPYNDAFWSSYNIIKENPLEVKLQKALTAPGKTLEETFKEKTLRAQNK